MPGENPTTKFKVDISELKAGIQESNRLIRLANSEFKAAASGMDNWANSTDGLEAKLKQLNTVQAAEEEKLKNLKEQYKLVAEAEGENSKGAQDLAIKINNQQAAVNKVNSELKNYEGQLEEVKEAHRRAEQSGNSFEDELNNIRNAADDAGDAAEDSSGGYTVLKNVIANLASQAISAAIQGFKDLALEGEVALDKLQAKVGATDKEMKGHADVVKNVYKGAWGESMAEVSEAVGTVINMTKDLNDADLQKVTENAMSLSDVYGWDVKESMRAVNSLMNQFGITSDEAFNLLVQGAQNGLDQNDDLLDTINEYSVQFKNAGFSADDMFNMLTNGAKSGTWSVDKLGDAVKEYNIRWQDGTAAEALEKLGFNAKDMAAKMDEGGEGSAKAMQAVIMALSGVEDEQERYMLGQKLMGTMWEDLGEEAVLSLMNTNGEISKTNDAMGQLKTDAYSNLATSVTSLGRTLKDELLAPIVDLIAPPITDFINWCIENINIVGPIVLGLATAFGVLATALAISGIISGVTKAIGILNATLLANPFVLIAALIAGVVVALVALWNKSDAFRSAVTEIFNGIKEAIGSAVSGIVKFFTETIPNAFTSVIEWIKTNWSTLLTIMINPFAGLFKYFYENNVKFKEFVDKAVIYIKELPGKVWSWLLATINKVGAFASDLLAKGAQAGSNFVNKIIEFVKGIPVKVWSWLSQTITKAGTFASNLAAKGTEAAQGLVKNITTKIQELPGKMVTMGGDIVKGLWNGINDMAGWIKSKIEGFGEGVLNSLKDFFGINSPSRVMRDLIGKNLVKGMEVGIDDESRNLIKTMKQSLGGAITGAQSSVNAALGGAHGGTVTNYNFTQNNTSPKALSRIDIYRQTRNQFRQLREV